MGSLQEGLILDEKKNASEGIMKISYITITGVFLEKIHKNICEYVKLCEPENCLQASQIIQFHKVH